MRGMLSMEGTVNQPWFEYPEAALEYYCSRLMYLEALVQRIDDNYFYLDSGDLVDQTDVTLGRLTAWLNLNTPSPKTMFCLNIQAARLGRFIRSHQSGRYGPYARPSPHRCSRRHFNKGPEALWQVPKRLDKRLGQHISCGCQPIKADGLSHRQAPQLSLDDKWGAGDTSPHYPHKLVSNDKTNKTDHAMTPSSHLSSRAMFSSFSGKLTIPGLRF
jgi:hypothetical protein